MLDAWTASPARFREDANAEESLAIGGYAGRVLVELASNAADAAREAGGPARIRVRLVGAELRVANTGSPLTAAGVAGLSSLRASAKRETLDSVGHFGVGFTAVLSWSRSPAVVSTTGGVRFDGDLTRAEIAAIGNSALDREVRLREGQVPVLRLPWPVDAAGDAPPEGYVTEVRLPLDPITRGSVERVLGDERTPQDLFWALPGLVEIDLPAWCVRRSVDDEGYTVIDDGLAPRRYRTVERSGRIPQELLAARPVEERHRAGWRVAWVLAVQDPPTDTMQAALALAGLDPGAPATSGAISTVGAPTPTDEQISLPARLIGTFPVDDTRRRLAAGPLGDYLLDQAADAYLELIIATEPAQRWELLPTGGFPVGGIDATLRGAVLDRAASTPLLVTAAGDSVLGRDACLLPGLGEEGTALLGQAIPGLLPPVGSAAAAVLRGLGVRVISWSEASAALAGIDRDADFWWRVYEAIAGTDRPPDTEELADIPVPLTGGRRSIGVRGCLLPGRAAAVGVGPSEPASDVQTGQANAPDLSGVIDAELAGRAGQVIPALRVIDPRAAHPLLARLGARPADPDTLLADPGLVTAVDDMRRDLEDADPDPDELYELATVVLDLLAAGGRVDRAKALDLVLTDEDGQPWPADELLVPGARLRDVLAPDVDRPVVGGQFAGRYSTAVLVAAGVRDGFAVLPLESSDGAGFDHPDLPELDEWLDLHDELPTSFTALADLDVVDPDRWPTALELIAGDREARACLGSSTAGLSYSGWWLSRHALIEGRPPVQWRLADAVDLAGLYDPLPVVMDSHLARSIGVRSDLPSAAADDPLALLDRLTDPERPVPAGRVASVTAAVVGALGGIGDLDLPSGVRAITGDVIDADAALVLDQPWLIQVLPAGRLVPGGDNPAVVARVLDLPLASETVRAIVMDGSGPADPGTARARLERAAAAVDLDLSHFAVTVIPDLRVVIDGKPSTVHWWAVADRCWVSGSVASVGRAAAWAAGRWPARHRATAAAADDWAALAEDSLG